MITAIRVLTPSGVTLALNSRTKSGRYKSGDGSQTLIELLHSLRESRVQGRVEGTDDESAIAEDIFDFTDPDIAIRTEAARLLTAEFTAVERAHADLLAEVNHAAGRPA